MQFGICEICVRFFMQIFYCTLITQITQINNESCLH